jgi:hypothetical protein
MTDVLVHHAVFHPHGGRPVPMLEGDPAPHSVTEAARLRDGLIELVIREFRCSHAGCEERVIVHIGSNREDPPV